MSNGKRPIREVVLVGAGHAHVEVLRAFGRRPIEGVQLTLLTREAATTYSGMLPGVVAGLYRPEQAQIDTGRLAGFARAQLRLGEAVGIDPAAQLVLCRDGPPILFDLLSMDVGSSSNTGDVPGASAHAIPVKPTSAFLEKFDRLLNRVRAGLSRSVGVVGGGAGGVELALAMERRLRREAPGALAMTLATASADILQGFPQAFQARMRATLAARRVSICTGARVTSVEQGAIILGAGRHLAADEILWVTESLPAPWLESSGLATDSGFVSVDATLRATDNIFAAGDMISFRPRAIPRSGVYAVRAGPVLAHNLRASIVGRRLRQYRPQANAMAIVTTGGPYALLTRNGLTLEGNWAWRLKDWIDRRWVARYTALSV